MIIPRFWIKIDDDMEKYYEKDEYGFLLDPEKNHSIIELEKINKEKILILYGSYGLGKSFYIKEYIEVAKNENEFFQYIDLKNEILFDEKIKEILLFIKNNKGENKTHIFLDHFNEIESKKRYSIYINFKEIENLSLIFICNSWSNLFQSELYNHFDFDKPEKINFYKILPFRKQDAINFCEGHIQKEKFFQILNLFSKGNRSFILSNPYFLRKLLKNDFIIKDMGVNEIFDKLISEPLHLYIEKSRQSYSLEEGFQIVGHIALHMLICNKKYFYVNCPGISEKKLNDDARANEIITNLIQSKEVKLLTEYNIVNLVQNSSYFTSINNYYRLENEIYQNYLAARYITEYLKLDISKILSLVTKENNVIIPKFKEFIKFTAEKNQSFAEWLLNYYPELLIQCDFSLHKSSMQIREKLIVNFLEKINNRKLLAPEEFSNYYSCLKCEFLENNLKLFLQSTVDHIPLTRQAAILIADACQLSNLSEFIAQIAFNENENYPLRQAAFTFLCKWGSAKIKIRVWELLKDGIPNDEDDQIKGNILIYHPNLKLDEILSVLSKRQKANHYGSYGFYLMHRFPDLLGPENVLPVLIWLTQHYAEDGLDHLCARLINRIIELLSMMAVESNIINILGKLLYEQCNLYSHRKNPYQIASEELQKAFQKLFQYNTLKMSIINNSLQNQNWNESLLNILLFQQYLNECDIFWFVDALGASTNSVLKAHLSYLILRLAFKISSPGPILDELLNVMEKDEYLKDSLKSFIAVELGSPQAADMKLLYDMQYNPAPVIEDNSFSRFKSHLDQTCEQTIDFDKWDNIYHFMTTSFVNDALTQEIFPAQFQTLANWQKASTEQQDKFIALSKKLLSNYTLNLNLNQTWEDLEKGNLSVVERGIIHPLLILYFLFQVEPGFIQNQCITYREKWASLIYLYPEEIPQQAFYKLFFFAYQTNSGKFFADLKRRMDYQQKHNVTFFWKLKGSLKFIWDPDVANFLLQYVMELDLNQPDTQKSHNALFIEIISLLKAQNLPINEEDLETKISELKNNDDEYKEALYHIGKFYPEFIQKKLLSLFSTQKDIARQLITKFVCGKFFYVLASLLSEDDLFNWYSFISTYDSAKGGYPRDFVATIRHPLNYILHIIRSRKTPEAVMSLKRIADEFPDAKILMAECEAHEGEMLDANYTPLNSKALNEFIFNPKAKYFNSEDSFLDAILVALKEIEWKALKGDGSSGYPSLAFSLWNYEYKKNKIIYKPKSENYFSDYIEWHLKNYFQESCVLINREVEIIRTKPKGAGKSVDLLIQLKFDTTERKRVEFSVVIECKISHHEEIFTAIETQLADTYLTSYSHGIYLIGWAVGQKGYKHPQRKTRDNRQKIRDMEIQEARDYFEAEARRLSNETKQIRSAILDIRLPLNVSREQQIEKTENTKTSDML